MRTLNVQVRTTPLTLTPTSLRAIANHAQYDHILFTSKNARRFFSDILKRKRVALPKAKCIIHVGPREELLRYDLKDKRLLFPRSDIAPFDIVKKLRIKGAVVRVVAIYHTEAVLLTKNELHALRTGEYEKISFRSPSGVTGLLKQLSPQERMYVRTLAVDAIGDTTAAAARKAGFRNVFVGIPH